MGARLVSVEHKLLHTLLGKGKGKVTLKQATKAKSGSKDIAVLFL